MLRGQRGPPGHQTGPSLDTHRRGQCWGQVSKDGLIFPCVSIMCLILRCARKGYPGFYIDVHHYIASGWLSEILKDEETVFHLRRPRKTLLVEKIQHQHQQWQYQQLQNYPWDQVLTTIHLLLQHPTIDFLGSTEYRDNSQKTLRTASKYSIIFYTEMFINQKIKY